MDTCRTCKYWIAEGCEAIEMVEGPVKLTGARIDASAEDDQGLSAYLNTGPDFGCTLHVPKNKKAK